MGLRQAGEQGRTERAALLVSFQVGALVRAREREWVVLPDSTDELLLLRPLGGSDEEVAGVLTSLERVEHARFAPPDPDHPGDHRSARLLRDALRLGFRQSAGPFRSFGRIAVEPRPYQLVPLLMALRMDPVRLLIADDVGIGKTIEAGLIARELLDTGAAARLAVLCPPHLAEQWQAELEFKFHLEATLVLPSTAARLERECAVDQTVFDLHPYVVVSTDFIKSDRRRHDFLRTCPELVIVDEAHTCATEDQQRGARHQRHELVQGLAAEASRHLLLVTATPHSGKENAFRSLLALLDPNLANLPDDLSGPVHEADRRRLARVMVQRRRGDILNYLGDTRFPAREEREESYVLTPDQKALFERVLVFARESVRDPSGGHHRQRVRYWSALALLRALASSPAAAEDTLRNRAPTADTQSAAEADAVGRRVLLDQGAVEDEELTDVSPGADYDDSTQGPVARRLRALAGEAAQLTGDRDAKLVMAARLIRELVEAGHQPIVFCRFIRTAEYVAEQLRQRLPRGVEVAAVTGRLPADDREARVEALARAPRHVLVATDCLSEGINLQEHFDTVVHYDLSWNPTRHEQREGRVDRFGQPKTVVRTLTLYGRDNGIDGIVLDVLLRKHRAIRKSTGVSVPVPGDADAVVEAVLEGLLLRQDADAGLEQLVLFESEFRPRQIELFGEWERSAERELRSRTMFAQESIKVDEVARELRDAREAVGRGADIDRFVRTAVEASGGVARGDRVVRIDLAEAPPGLRDATGTDHLDARFEGAPGEGQVLLNRTSPFVSGLAAWVLDSSLDSQGGGIARRCGTIRTAAVERRSTLLLLRHRFHLVVTVRGRQRALLAEECGLLAFEGPITDARWLDAGAAERLLLAVPAGNVDPGQAAYFLRQVVDGLEHLGPRLEQDAQARAAILLDSHRRVRRQSGGSGGAGDRVEAQLPPDVLGLYVYLPAGGG
jgi:superfamily II DNA or RNA helicase